MNQIRLEAVDRFGDRRSRQGEFQFRVEGQRHGRHADHPGSHVLLRAAFRAEHHHLIPGLHEMPDRLGQTGDDAVDLGQEGFSEEGDFQG